MFDPEPALVRDAASGDLDAFEELVRGLQAPVWRFVLGMVRDPALAEDVTQETFLRVFDRMGSFRFESRFSTWVFQIARNQAVDAMRRRDRQRQVAVTLVDDTSPPEGLHSEVEAAIATLSDRLRAALLLVEVAGFSCREAGEILGVPAGTIKSRLFHARRQLVDWFTADADLREEDGR